MTELPRPRKRPRDSSPLPPSADTFQARKKVLSRYLGLLDDLEHYHRKAAKVEKEAKDLLTAHPFLGNVLGILRKEKKEKEEKNEQKEEKPTVEKASSSPAEGSTSATGARGRIEKTIRKKLARAPAPEEERPVLPPWDSSTTSR